MATSKKKPAREKENESYLVKVAKKHSGNAFKYTSPSRRSVPDRITVIPCFDPVVQFVEVKAEGKKPTDSQVREHERIRKAGGTVHVVDSKEQIDDLFFFCCNGSCK